MTRSSSRSIRIWYRSTLPHREEHWSRHITASLLGPSLISIIGSGLCGAFVFIVISALGPRGIELH